MTRQQAAWLKKPEPDPLFDHSHEEPKPIFDPSREEPKPIFDPSREDHPYVHANVLGPSTNTYTRRLNYSTIFCVAVLVVAFFGWLLGN
jgi:hypothetical protein